MLAPGPLLGALSSEQIFERASPAVVQISNIEGHGSGVLINSNGRILTNYHVVSSPLPLTVRAKIQVDGTWVEKSYDEIELVSVHPKLDLAIIQIKGASGQFHALSLDDSKVPKPGARCYVIGNPDDGMGGALNNSITSGVISALDFEHDGAKYLQLSAPINPGNSGGALLDNEGKLLGIVTFKIVGREGMGFAIGIDDFTLDHFLDRKKRVAWPAEASILAEDGDEIFVEATRELNSELAAFLYQIAGYYYRESLLKDPGNFRYYLRIGLVYNGLEEYEVALAYLQEAKELNGEHAKVREALGRCLAKLGRKDEARKEWLYGAFLDPNDGAASCAHNFAVDAAEQEKWLTVYYFNALSKLLNPRLSPSAKAELQSIAEDQVAFKTRNIIDAKRNPEEFSIEDFNRLFQSGQSNAQQESNLAHWFEPADFYPDPIRRMPLGAEVTLPGIVQHATLGGNGRYVIMSFEEVPKLVVYDTIKAELVGELDLPASQDVIFAAGGQILLVYHLQENRFEAYGLPHLVKLATKEAGAAFKLRYLVMGCGEGRAAMVVHTEPNGIVKYSKLDLPSFKLVPLPYNGSRIGRSRSREYAFSTSPFLKHVVSWDTSRGSKHNRWTDCYYFTVNLPASHLRLFLDNSSVDDIGARTICGSGQYICSTGGRLYRNRMSVAAEYDSPVISAFDNYGFALLPKGKRELLIKDFVEQETLETIKLPWNLPKDETILLSESFARKLYFGAESDRLTIIHHNEPKLYTVGLRANGEIPLELPEVAAPNELWIKDLELETMASGFIEAGPVNSVLSGDRLSWKVPEGYPQGPVEFLIATDQKRSRYKLIRVDIKAAPSEGQTAGIR